MALTSIDLLTLHPEMVRGPLTSSILGRAIDAGLIRIGIHDIRDHGVGKHRQCDDAPYGGGPGMVLKVDVVARAIEEVVLPGSHIVMTAPDGEVFDQDLARQLSEVPHLVILAGHYEGIDARIETMIDRKISLGDFVLTGGEIAAAAIVDATVRLLPGVLGNDQSSQDESFSNGLLEYPQYTRPQEWRSHAVPKVLMSGHHQQIREWRLQASKEKTMMLRPDLYRQYQSRIDGERD